MDSMEEIQFHGNSAGIPERQPYLRGIYCPPLISAGEGPAKLIQ